MDDEANDEEAGQRGGTGGERGAHDQTLAEIVQANAERDEAGERHAARRRTAPTAEAEQHGGGEKRGDPDQRLAAKAAEGFSAKLEALAERVDHQEDEQADGQRQQEAQRAGTGLAYRWISEQADRDGREAEQQSDERQASSAPAT